MASIKSYVNDLIKSKKVVIFSKSHCPFCTTAKNAINSFKLADGALEIVEIDKFSATALGDMDQIQDYLMLLTGSRSVPRVFIAGKFYGGGDDTEKALKSGALEKELRNAGALAV